MMLLDLRVRTRSRTRPASGSERVTGTRPKVMETVSPSSWTSSTVSWVMVAMRCAYSSSSSPGDSVADREGVIVEEAFGVVPAFLGVVRPGGPSPADRAEGQATGVSVANGPADEVRGLVAIAISAGRPGVEVGLSAVGQCVVVVGEPVQEVRGRGDVAADVRILQACGVHLGSTT